MMRRLLDLVMLLIAVAAVCYLSFEVTPLPAPPEVDWRAARPIAPAEFERQRRVIRPTSFWI